MDNQYFFNSGIPPPLPMPTWQTPAAAYIGGGSNNPNNSCYTTPSNSPPQLKFLIMNHSVKENLPNLGTPMAVNPNLPTLTADPGFSERAAKFSSLGSRSFNGRTSQLTSNNTELQYRSSPLMGIETIPRVLSSPSLKAAGSPMGVQENRNFTQTHMNLGEVSRYSALDRAEFASSNEGSSVSEQIPNGENVVVTPSDSNSKKRKSVSRGKSKVAESEDELNTKRSKSTESSEIGNDNGAGEEDQKQEKTNPKPAEPLKDYIHVRARRGQATDSHSLAERVRREKIGERMKLLQDLVPGCNKVTGKALMLDEIINYVQSLQRQVEFLSMKLASVNPGLDFDTDSIFSKDVSQSNDSYPHPVFPLDSSASRFFGQSHKNPSNLVVSQCSMDPLDTALCQNIGTMVDEFGQGLPQFLSLCEDDLQSIVQMGLGRSPNRDMGFHSQSFPGSSQTSHMKIEL